MIALIYEVWNDRHGDLNKQTDLIWRTAFILAEAGLLTWAFHKPYYDSILLCTAVFIMLFDYLIAYVLIRNKVIEPRRGTSYTWFTYIGKKGFFDVYIWKNANPWVRFGIKLGVFITALIIFIL